ncbi:oligosaccharide flippase family protein [Pasteurellaceae bacterium 22721_9_1]
MKAIKDSAIYLIGELISKAMPFLLLPYLSRKLGVEGFGELSYFQTYISLFAIVLGLSQDGAIARYFYFYGKRSLDLVLKTGYSYTITLGIFLSIIAYLVHSEILFYTVWIAVFQSILSVQLSVRQCQKKAISYTVIQFMSAIALAITTVIMLEFYDTNLVEKRILAMLFANIIVCLISYFFYKKEMKTRKILSYIKYKKYFLYLVGFGFPLLFHHVSFFLKGQVDRMFIYHKFSESELGLYAMGAQLATILTVLIMSVNKALVPYLFDSLKKNKLTLNKLHKLVFLSFFLMPFPILISYFIPEQWILWILGDKFEGVKYYFIMFLISSILVIPYLILVNYLFYYGKNKMISFCSVLSTMIYLVCLLFFTDIGVKYIPYASIIGAVSMLPILYMVTIRVNRGYDNGTIN